MPGYWPVGLRKVLTNGVPRYQVIDPVDAGGRFFISARQVLPVEAGRLGGAVIHDGGRDEAAIRVCSEHDSFDGSYLIGKRDPFSLPCSV